jgi:hypothetical protein
MINLFVRLVVSGTVATMIGATALADGASIQLTGPGSTNAVTSSNYGSFNSNVRNWVAPSNWNSQYAASGPVRLGWNTNADLGGGGSGNAYNSNMGENDVQIQNSSPNFPMSSWGGGNGGGNGSIYLTGPYSSNRISSNNDNRFSSNINNVVNSTNYNNQTARSGGVEVTGNTLVEGVGGSGDAANFNSGTNTAYISNGSSTPVPAWTGSNGNGSANISTTGPGSYNAIGSNSRTSFLQNTQNDVNSTNYNQQNATSGNVLISGNTVVNGAGGSGSAYNSNSGQNGVALSN